MNTALTSAGTTQADALAITADVNVFGTVGASSGAILQAPAPSGGDTVLVKNGGANALLVYPQSGGTIDGGSANAAYSVAAGETAMFIAVSSTAWLVIVGG